MIVSCAIYPGNVVRVKGHISVARLKNECETALATCLNRRSLALVIARAPVPGCYVTVLAMETVGIVYDEFLEVVA